MEGVIGVTIPLEHGTVDLERGEVTARDGAVVRLTERETRLVRYLWERSGRLVSRGELLRAVLGYSAGARTRALDMAITRVRAKIEPSPREPVHLRTAHGDGYCFYPAQDAPMGAGGAGAFTLGDRRVDLDAATVVGGAGMTHLTPREADLLSVLWRRQGAPIDGRDLWSAAGGEGFCPRSLVAAIHRLRHKLEPHPARPRFLVAHRTRGYALVGPSNASTGPRLDELLWGASEHVGELLGVEDCVIYLRDGNHLVQAAAIGVKKTGRREVVAPLVLRVGEGIVGAAAAAGRTEIVADTQADERYVGDAYPGRSELCVPILRGEELLGVVDTESREVAAYGPREARLVESVASLIAAGAADLARAVR